MKTRYFVPWSAYADSPHEALDHIETNHGRVVRAVLDRGMGGKVSACVEIEIDEEDAGE